MAMAEDLFALTGDQVSRIKSMLDWYENGAPSHDRKRERRPAPLDTRRRRLAKTTTESTGSAYPTTGDTFWCKFVDGEYGGGRDDADEGDNTATFTAWAGGEKVLAHSRHGIYFAENTVVEIDQFNGQWWIQRPIVPSFIAYSTDLTSTTSGSVAGLDETSPSNPIDEFTLASNIVTSHVGGYFLATYGGRVGNNGISAGQYARLIISLQVSTNGGTSWNNNDPTYCVATLFGNGNTGDTTISETVGVYLQADYKLRLYFEIEGDAAAYSFGEAFRLAIHS